MDSPGGKEFRISSSASSSRHNACDSDDWSDTDSRTNFSDSYDKEQTALLVAARNKNISAVRHLLEKCFNPSVSDSQGWTALHHAARMGHEEMLVCLLEAKAKIDAQSQRNETPLYISAWQGRTECVEILLKEAAKQGKESILNCSAENGKTPLMVAAQHGHASCVQILLDNGADPALTTSSKMTALHLAVIGDHARCLEIIAAKMDLRPLIESCHPESVNLGIDRKYNFVSPIYLAVKWQSYSCLKLLLELGFSPDSVHGNTDLPSVFISQADFGTYDSAVSFAVKNEDKKALNILFAAGASCTSSPCICAYHPIARALDLPRTDILDILLDQADNPRYGRKIFELTIVLLSSATKPNRTRNLLLYGCDPRISFEMEMTNIFSHIAPFVISDPKELVSKIELFLQFSIINGTVQKACRQVVEGQRVKSNFCESLWANIISTISKPSSLKHSSRMAIRRYMYSLFGPGFVRKLPQLLLPPFLEAYISFGLLPKST